MTDVVCSYCGARYETVIAPEFVSAIRRCAYCHRRGLRVQDGTSRLFAIDVRLAADEDCPGGDES